MKNKLFLIIGLILGLIIIILICIFAYKKTNNGNNNINKSEEEIIDKILNLKSYNASINVEIQTNKNNTKYVVRQTSEEPNKSKQEVIKPENIAGVTTEYDGNNLIIKENKMNLTTTIENYDYLVDNNLWLNSFINDYKIGKNTKIEHSNNEIVLEVKADDNNKYSIYKKLHIDQNTGKPTKLIIQDINKKTLMYILYNEIEIS